jgi:PAT family acetyl-CoA transporter-like MFS transporter 1
MERIVSISQPSSSQHIDSDDIELQADQPAGDYTQRLYSSHPPSTRPTRSPRNLQATDPSLQHRDGHNSQTQHLLAGEGAEEPDDETADTEEDDSEEQMGKARPAASKPKNGHATGTMPAAQLEHRRKQQMQLGATTDSFELEDATRSSATARLMARNSFSLDEPVPTLPGDLGHAGSESKAKGFSELPEKDRRNFLVLVLLYFLQGLPMGLAMGSVPFLLKEHVSYAQMGVFSLASYPYSLKLLWSPIVDAVWSPKLGRRKSWILPIQFLSGLGMLWLSGHSESMMNHAGDNGGQAVWGFTWWWFGLVFMCATQDIAVDGWAITLLSTENLSYASTAQTVGLTAGQFLTSTIFLAFNSKEFANKWFRTVPLETGIVTLGGVLAMSGWLYLIVTVGLAVLKREDLAKNEEGVWDTYKVMVGILKLRNVQALMLVHLIAKIGFQANDGATTLKLLDKKFGQDNLALTVLIDFPFEIGLGYYVGKWSSQYGAMQLWSWAFMGRLGAALLAQFIVYIFPSGGVTTPFLILVIIGHVFSTFMNTVMFVAVSAFHAIIADPVYGGTYMTLLAT